MLQKSVVVFTNIEKKNLTKICKQVRILMANNWAKFHLRRMAASGNICKSLLLRGVLFWLSLYVN